MGPKKSQRGRGGRPNYVRQYVIDAIRLHRPKGAVGWRKVALMYQQLSQERTVRDPQDIKRFFIKKLCNNYRVITGEAAPSAEIAEAQALGRELETEAEVQLFGESDSENEEEEDDFPQMEDFFPTGNSSSTLTQPLAAVPATEGVQMLEAPLPPSYAAVSRKRAREDSFRTPSAAGAATDGEGMKTKNSRNATRSSAASALNNLAETINQNGSSSAMLNIMNMQMQMQRETMQSFVQMMTMMMLNRSAPLQTPDKENDEEKDEEKKDN